MAEKLSAPEPCYGILPTGREVNTTVFCRDRNCSSINHRIPREAGSKTHLSSSSILTPSTFPSQSEVELKKLGLGHEDPESYGSNQQLVKGIPPTSSSRWGPRRLIAQVRAGKVKRKSCVLFVLAPCTVILVIVIAVVAYFTVRAKKHPNLTVDLGYAQYKGFRTSNGIDKWFGMRYAAPPLGDLRFRAPQDPLSASKQTAFQVSLPPFLCNIA